MWEFFSAAALTEGDISSGAAEMLEADIIFSFGSMVIACASVRSRREVHPRGPHKSDSLKSISLGGPSPAVPVGRAGDA